MQCNGGALLLEEFRLSSQISSVISVAPMHVVSGGLHGKWLNEFQSHIQVRAMFKIHRVPSGKKTCPLDDSTRSKIAAKDKKNWEIIPSEVNESPEQAEKRHIMVNARWQLRNYGAEIGVKFSDSYHHKSLPCLSGSIWAIFILRSSL